jgi:hypothetical protein
MQLVGQYSGRIDPKCPLVQTKLRCVAQHIDMADKEIRLFILQADSKEIGAVGHHGGTVI